MRESAGRKNSTMAIRLLALVALALSCNATPDPEYGQIVCKDRTNSSIERSKIIFYGQFSDFFEIGRDEGTDEYYPNMICNLEWTPPATCDSYVDFGPCSLANGISTTCDVTSDDHAAVEKVDGSSTTWKVYCGAGDPRIHTLRSLMKAEVITNSVNEETGCAGFLLSDCSSSGRRRRSTLRDVLRDWYRTQVMKRMRRNTASSCTCNVNLPRTECPQLLDRFRVLAGLDVLKRDRTALLCTDWVEGNECVDVFFQASELECDACQELDSYIAGLEANLPSTEVQYAAALVQRYYQCDQRKTWRFIA